MCTISVKSLFKAYHFWGEIISLLFVVFFHSSITFLYSYLLCFPPYFYRQFSFFPYIFPFPHPTPSFWQKIATHTRKPEAWGNEKLWICPFFIPQQVHRRGRVLSGSSIGKTEGDALVFQRHRVVLCWPPRLSGRRSNPAEVAVADEQRAWKMCSCTGNGREKHTRLKMKYYQLCWLSLFGSCVSATSAVLSRSGIWWLVLNCTC